MAQSIAFGAWFAQFQTIEAQKEGGNILTAEVARTAYDGGKTPEEAVADEDDVLRNLMGLSSENIADVIADIDETNEDQANDEN